MLKFAFITLFLLSTILNSSVEHSAENEKNEITNNESKHLLLVAGSASHSTGTHEHRAGVLLFERCLASVSGLEVSTHFEGWPDDDGAFDNADAVVLYMDGGVNHPVVQGNRLQLMQQHIDRGIGFGAIHYAVEVPKENGGEQYLDWIGGYYETNYSANPIWEANYENIPNHPIMRGVQSFNIEDEWYFSIRFRPGMTGVTPLLVANPSDETRDGPYVHPRGPYEHIMDRKGESEVMSWVVERKDGGRGLGFTGGHFHKNWGDDGFRTYALNAMVWLTGLDVPQNGVNCRVTDEDLEENLDH